MPVVGLTQVMQLAEFNALPAGEAQAQLLSCCAAPLWANQMATDRPYPDPDALHQRAELVLAQLPWDQIEAALAAHPRIGERRGDEGREAAWSRQEQAGALDAETEVKLALAQANRAYEQRFGHVFLICATGRSAQDMLEHARARLGNDVATEQGVIRRELAAITQLRLGRLVTP